jgi:hypothetical protein
MIAVQGENTADVDDYQLKTSTFYEMSTYALQKESNEATVQYVRDSFGPLKSENILPIQPFEKNTEMSLFDLQTVGFWSLKNATNIADIAISAIS